MRLLDNSTTRNIFNVLNESVQDVESREQAVERAAEEVFDGSDFFLNNASYKEDTSGNTNGWVAFNVTAYGGEPDGNGEIELNRDVELPIKYNGYVEETKGLDLDDFYTLVSETLSDWVSTHNSPDSFYESNANDEPIDEKELWDCYLDIAQENDDIFDYNKVMKLYLENHPNQDTHKILETIKKLDRSNFNQAMELFNGKDGYISEFGQEAYDNWVKRLEESVMINTGSTTVTSDETGVVIEDNGNTITTGNGVTVDIDNEADVLPDEMDVAEPVDEIPADVAEEPVEELPEEPTEEIDEPIEEVEDDEDLDESVEEDKKEDLDEAIDKDGGPFPYLMKHGQGPGTLPNDVKIVKYGESSNDKDIVYLNKVLTAEEEAKYDMKPMEKLEDCDTKLIQEADGYNQNQNVEIYQNPEFDYQILDITELDNTDTGDVRAIDMANILNDLDESLTEATGTNRWGEINSFLTRKGTHKKTNESYSSAILELTLPRLNESVGEYKNVFMLEVYGDGALKECVVRNSKSQIIKEYCGKTKDPVKHFEGVIFDIMNSRMVEEVVPMVNEPMEDKGVNFADGKAIDKDEERQEKHIKQHEDKNKEKKFEIGKEPDQENTAGKTEEEITDTAEVEALPKAKKTKVDAEKIKVKEIKESATETKEIVMDEGEPEILCIDQYNYIGPANKIDSMIRYYDMETPEWLVDELNSYGNKIIELDCGDHYPECFDKENCSISREVPTEEYIELLKQASVPSRGGQEFGEKLKQNILNKLSESAKLNEAEDELLDEPIVTDGTEAEDELTESGSDVAIFHRKPASVDAMRAAEQNGITVNKSNYKIVGTKELSNDEFNQFANHLSSEEYDWLKEYNDTSNSGEFKCVEVINTDDDSFSILVDPQGYSYARYAAIKDNTDEEELLEPEEELLDEPTEEPTEEVKENE